MRTFPALVIYDATHSLQHPGAGGDRRFALPLARSAMAAGAQGLFVETHPEPEKALSDASTQLPLDWMPGFLDDMLSLRRLTAEWESREDR
jgi:2-dehydro-3-deoxyphosphooctonate aldolase (KDO 8-P synthase)